MCSISWPLCSLQWGIKMRWFCSTWLQGSDDCCWFNEGFARCWFWCTTSLPSDNRRDSSCGRRDAGILYRQVIKWMGHQLSLVICAVLSFCSQGIWYHKNQLAWIMRILRQLKMKWGWVLFQSDLTTMVPITKEISVRIAHIWFGNLFVIYLYCNILLGATI